MISRVKSIQFQTDFNSLGLPEMVRINYDLEKLTIHLNFEESGKNLIVNFSNPRGFRIMNESDLGEFWNQLERPLGWLWIIEKRGWKELEADRGWNTLSYDTDLVEYFVVGIEDCASILSKYPPKIEAA